MINKFNQKPFKTITETKYWLLQWFISEGDNDGIREIIREMLNNFAYFKRWFKHYLEINM